MAACDHSKPRKHLPSHDFLASCQPFMVFKRLDPKLDYVFKRILCQGPIALCSMLNAVLQLDSPVEHATVLNPEIQAETIKGKQIRMDIRARLADNTLINIEFQTRLHNAFSERLLYYWARMYSQALPKGQDYEKLVPTHVIAWTQKILVPHTPFHSIFEVRERRSSRLLSPHLQIHLLELAKLDDPNLEINPTLRLWAQFLATSDPERYTELAEQDPGIKEAVSILQELSQDPQAQAEAQAREDELRLFHHELQVADEQGEARGIELGLTRGRKEGREEGIELGQRRTLSKLLAQRFGELPDAAHERIESASSEELDRWLSRVLDAQCLDDVFLSDA